MGKQILSFDKMMEGDTLCRLVNKIQPGTITRINLMNHKNCKMENVKHFLEGCRKIGIPGNAPFDSADFLEKKEFDKVGNRKTLTCTKR